MSMIINPYRFAAAGGGGGFKPTDLSGLLAWYSAESETGYADGAQMTGWTDLSGLGNHAVAAGTTAPVWQATTGAGGGPAVYYGGAGYFTLPASLMGSAAAGEVHVQIKSDGINCGLWAFGQAGANQESHYPYDGTIYESFGLANGQRQAKSSPTPGITAWRRYNIWSAASDWSMSLDETVQTTYVSGTVAWETSPVLGRGKNTALDMYYRGHMATVLLFNRKLTSTERGDVVTWMQANPSGGTP